MERLFPKQKHNITVHLLTVLGFLFTEFKNWVSIKLEMKCQFTLMFFHFTVNL